VNVPRRVAQRPPSMYNFASEIANLQETGQKPPKDVVSDQQRGPAHSWP